MSIYVGTSKVKDICVGAGVDDYSAMQGPCPEGFHIPSQTEWSNVKTAGVTLGAWTSSGYSDFRNKLKIPAPGYRYYKNGSMYTGARYWCCNNTGNANGYELNLESGINFYADSKSSGLFIRAFKDVPVVPNSSWTTIQSGSGGAGIYHNSTLGVISISADGSTRYTIADKNVGATTVWNSGNSNTSANCGKNFQRGNCYGFNFDGYVTTTTSKTDASSYGPTNYFYKSSFYITNSNTAADWSSVTNNNLWGYTTGKKTKGNVKAVYVGTTKVRPDGFTPSSSTVAYYDFKANSLDLSGNGNNLFMNGYGSIGPLHTGPSANFDGNGYLRTSNNLSLSNYTIIYRLYFSGEATSYVFAMPTFPASYIYKYSSLYSLQITYKASSSGTSGMGGAYISQNSWFMVAMTKSGANYNGYYFASATPTVYTKTGYDSTASGVLTIGADSSGNNKINGSIGTFIVENTARSQTNIQNLYNKTKSLYGK